MRQINKDIKTAVSKSLRISLDSVWTLLSVTQLRRSDRRRRRAFRRRAARKRGATARRAQLCRCIYTEEIRSPAPFVRRAAEELHTAIGWLIAAPLWQALGKSGEVWVGACVHVGGWGGARGQECTRVLLSDCYPHSLFFFFFTGGGWSTGKGEEGSVIWPDGAVGQRGVVIKHTLTLWSPRLCIWLPWRSASHPHRAPAHSPPHKHREGAQAQVVRSSLHTQDDRKYMAVMTKISVEFSAHQVIVCRKWTHLRNQYQFLCMILCIF